MLDDSRWGEDSRDRGDDDWRDQDERSDFAFGRGSDSDRAADDALDRGGRGRDDDRRGLDRDHEQRDRAGGVDPRDAFMRHVDLPRDREREIVRDRDRDHKLRGSESRTLSTVGAFRVVSARDLRDYMGRVDSHFCASGSSSRECCSCSDAAGHTAGISTSFAESRSRSSKSRRLVRINVA